MRILGNHGSAKTFTGVDEGIYEHGFLQNGELFERAPGVVGAAEENHRRHDEAEHEADVGLLHAAAEGQATGRGEQSDEQCNDRKENGMGHVQVHAGTEQQPSGGDHHEAGGEGLQRASNNLLDGQPGNFHRSEQTVFDFVRELELSDQGHRDGPDASADHDAAEDEHEHQRLQKGLKHQRDKVAASDVGIAREHGEKGLPVHSRKLLPVWCRKRFSKLGSEICTSCSSTPEAEARCATSGISKPPRSAYTSAPKPSVARTSRTPESFCRRPRNSAECRPNRNRSRKPPGTEAFNSRGVPRAITRPWSMMARRWQSASASSML